MVRFKTPVRVLTLWLFVKSMVQLKWFPSDLEMALEAKSWAPIHLSTGGRAEHQQLWFDAQIIHEPNLTQEQATG